MFKSKHGYEVKADISADMTDQEEFDAVIIPGGFAPDRLHRFPAVNEFVKRMFQEGRWWRQFTMAGLSWLRRTSSGAGRSLASCR
jgi:protease I